MSDNGDFWSGVIVTAALAGALYYCTNKDDSPKAPDNTFSSGSESISPKYYTPSVPAAPTPTPPAPKPNYRDKEGGTYYYVAAVSEEERKAGQATGDVMGYRYGGKDETGAHIVYSGTVRYTCSVPCKIIKGPQGTRIAFNEGSIIGAVFEDAMRGFLKAEPSRPKPKSKPVVEESEAGGPWQDYQSDPVVSSGSTPNQSDPTLDQ